MNTEEDTIVDELGQWLMELDEFCGHCQTAMLEEDYSLPWYGSEEGCGEIVE